MVDCPPSGTSTASEWRQRLFPSVALAWRAFDRVSGLPWRVTPAVPILFFGDLDAYLTSPLRVLTVGLNPSLHEFPADEPFRRFPLAGDSGNREPGRYLDAMSAYFHTDPYGSWFRAFEQVLNGAGSSYYKGEAASTALHTDICSPVATDPTWNDLGEAAHAALVADGRPLWRMLLKVLRPQIVALSVARKHLRRIEFEPMTRVGDCPRIQASPQWRPPSAAIRGPCTLLRRRRRAVPVRFWPGGSDAVRTSVRHWEARNGCICTEGIPKLSISVASFSSRIREQSTVPKAAAIGTNRSTATDASSCS